MPSLLLLLVVGAHYLYDPLASFYANHDTAARNIAYILGGVETFTLYVLVWALTPHKPAPRFLAVSVVCAWGALESMQKSVCQAALGIDYFPESTGLYRGLCDLVTGWPVYMLTVCAVLTMFALNYTKKR